MDRPLNISSLPTGAAPVNQERATLERQKATELAQEFESIMMLQMLRQMRQTMLDDEDGEKGLSADTMTDTIDTELARQLSRSGGIGLATTLTKAMEQRAASVPPLVGGVGATLQPGMSAMPLGMPVGMPLGMPLATPSATPSAAPYLHTHESVGALSGKTAALTSPYGWRADPFTGAQKYHAGIDLGAAYGTGVPAAGGGKVVSVGDQGAYGTQVVVEHEPGLQTRYAHLSSVTVTVGERVAQGQEIGRVGQSGRATGPHLHFEVIRDGQRVDPTGALALDGAGLGGLKLLGSDADLPVGGRVSPFTTTGAEDENLGQQPKS
jgi:murein DD-endopeptidase MepM/ murein hydrolase activator NlpD